MRQLFFSWLFAVFISLSAGVTVAQAQVFGRPSDQGNSSAEANERAAPALQYAMAFFMTVLIMLILCMPSRKRQAQ
jgi:hypothetical protein